MMIPSMAGVFAFLVFAGMILLAVLFILISLLVRVSGGARYSAVKLSMISITFFISGLLGMVLLHAAKDQKAQRFYDHYVCWIVFLLAVVVSLLIAYKKENKSGS